MSMVDVLRVRRASVQPEDMHGHFHVPLFIPLVILHTKQTGGGGGGGA